MTRIKEVVMKPNIVTLSSETVQDNMRNLFKLVNKHKVLGLTS